MKKTWNSFSARPFGENVRCLGEGEEREGGMEGRREDA
jgi:hypothetical protein